jgi:hypothetical protein
MAGNVNLYTKRRRKKSADKGDSFSVTRIPSKETGEK